MSAAVDSDTRVSLSDDELFSSCIRDAVGLSQAELVALIRSKEVERRRLDAELSALCSVLDAKGCFPDGHRSLKGFLKANLNLAGISAHRQRQISRLIDRYPSVGDAWMAGQVGRDQVAELAKVAQHPRVGYCFAEFADQLLEAAVRFEYDEFMLVVQRFMLGADPDGAHDDRDTAIEGRSARLVINGGQLDGTIIGGDPLIAQEMKAVFDAYVNHEYQIDQQARRDEFGDNALTQPLARTAAQRRFDAFVNMIRAAGNNTDADTSQPVVDFCVNVVIDEDRFHDMLTERQLADVPTVDDALALIQQAHNTMDGSSGNGKENGHDAGNGSIIDDIDIAARCETEDGEPLHPHDVLRAALTGHVRRVIVDSQSVVIDLGRKQRLFTGSARTAAKLLATQCCHPGCDLPTEWSHIDHNVPWAQGGPTDQHNANPPCPTHNQVKEKLGLRYFRDRHGHRRTQRPDGTTILAVGMPPPL